MTAPRRPTRATAAGRAYLDLQNLARRRGRPTDELHQLYALEGFLTRLSLSRHANQLILKGGALLAAYDIRRPTRDVDLQVRAINADLHHLRGLVAEIAAITVDDGLVFDTAGATAQTIREGDEHSGVRVATQSSVSTCTAASSTWRPTVEPRWNS